MATVTDSASVESALAVHIYVSEGRDPTLITQFVNAASPQEAQVVNEFVDAAYHRAGITLACANAEPLERNVVAICQEALLSLSLQKHKASHPRLGVVDHVACNPLGSASLNEAGDLARRIAMQLGGGSSQIAVKLKPPGVPVYLYGAAHSERRSLADVRRQLGYFTGARSGEWLGLAPEVSAAVQALPPDFGPRDVHPDLGVTVVGAVQWVHNYNLLLAAEDNSLDQSEIMKRCRKVARAVSARGGGLPAVESMALPHEAGVEIACNLLDVGVSSAAAVRSKVLELSSAEGLKLRDDYFTNKKPEDILKTLAE